MAISTPTRAALEQMIADVQAESDGLDKTPALTRLQAQLDALPPDDPSQADPEADEADESAEYFQNQDPSGEQA